MGYSERLSLIVEEKGGSGGLWETVERCHYGVGLWGQKGGESKGLWETVERDAIMGWDCEGKGGESGGLWEIEKVAEVTEGHR